MSRRHKDKEETINYKPHQAESQADGSPRDKSDEKSTGIKLLSGLKFSITKRGLGAATRHLAERITRAIGIAFEKQTIEVDDQWVKIPRTAFEKADDDLLQQFLKIQPSPPIEDEPPKRGRNPITRLIRGIADSKVVSMFKTTLTAVKAKCMELYENISQFCTCFLKGIHKAFSPDDDPYGKITHFHEILVQGGVRLPTRRTLSNYYKWFEDWRRVVINETAKERKERERHRLWERLIEWIYKYLLKLVPQYAT